MSDSSRVTNDQNHQNDHIVGKGIDIPRSRRPGSPMESTPRQAAGAHWEVVPRQPETAEILRRSDLRQLTPVFGSAQPPHGLSGALRRYAYSIPDHKPRHWAILLFADRVDVTESALADLFRARPVAATAGIALLAGAAVALWLGASRSRRPRLLQR
jgi:hypothetical protein